MKNQIKKFYKDWKSRKGISEKVYRSWHELSDNIGAVAIEGQIDWLQDEVKKHCAVVEEKGFYAGFCYASAIWKECTRISL